MQGEPTTFWGKIDRSIDGSGQCVWHPLFDHCADVAAVVEALLCLPVWRQRFSRLAGSNLDDVLVARLSVLACLHDIGKLNLGFQAKGRPVFGTTAGHVVEAVSAVFRPEVFSCLSEFLGWGDAVTDLLVSAVCHHGRPLNANLAADSGWQATLWKPRSGLDPVAGGRELVNRSRVWFPRAFEANRPPLPDLPAFSHAFAGLVMLADWIGSDPDIFPFSREGDPDRMVFARLRAREALALMGFDVPKSKRSDLYERDSFNRVVPDGFLPRPAQRAMLRVPLEPGGSIAVLEAETGSGKTEAALARFVELFDAGMVDGMYFALPTRSAATQIHRRVVDAVSRAFRTPPGVVLAVPGYLRVDDVEGRPQVLPRFDVLWPDQERFRYRAWAAETPKRFLAGCIVVGTIDQVLLSSLAVRHAHLRATSLLRHLLVVDEVHSSDAYMARILEHVLERHRAVGGHALLLSATLGAEARTRLLNPGRRTTPPSLKDAVSTAYPLISHQAQEISTFAADETPINKAVVVTTHAWLDNAEALAEAAMQEGMKGGKVLIIKNTVRDCIRTQQALEQTASRIGRIDLLFECAGAPAPHHSRYARIDREALDKSLENNFGQVRTDRGCVVVATQTVQQSLDIDADVLFTDLCPTDVLLQRIGRLQRHSRGRRDSFLCPRACVVVPELRDLGALLDERGRARDCHGLGSVYPDLRVLEATWRLIETEPQWRVPSMNRYLVEQSLHSTALAAIVVNASDKWQLHDAQMAGLTRGHERLAQLNLVDWGKSYAEQSFSDQADRRITTRLGEGDRLVRFPSPMLGPFGNPINELTLRSWWATGAPEDAQPSQLVCEHGATQFRFGDREFVYDRLGLRLSKQRVEVDEDDGP